MPKSAFTLLELLIVITIVAILAGVMVPLFKTSRGEAEIAKCRADLEALADAGRRCYYDTKQFFGPDPLETGPTLVPGWKGPYIDKVKSDPWGMPYESYAVDCGTRKTMYYRSLGPNKTLDTQGDDISIFVASNPNWTP